MNPPQKERHMSAYNLRFIDVTFSYDTSTEPVISSLTVHFSRGWSGIVGPNGTGKSTVAKLAAGILSPSAGSVITSGVSTVYYCEQEAENLPEFASDFLSGAGSHSGKIHSMLGIKSNWADRWETLSPGERKRLQIGIALWKEPDIIVLDEPVNHLDSMTKQIVLPPLLSYNGTGIIISHDREFLDSLCHSCLFMRPGYAVMRRGNFSEGFAQQQIDDRSREKRYLDALSRYNSIRQRALLLKQSENGKAGNLSKRNIPRHDHDAKSRVDGARLTGKDKKGARKAAILGRRAEDTATIASSLYFRQRQVEGIIFTGEKSRRDCLVRLGYGDIPLGPLNHLRIPELEIFPEDRIAITGNNGTGKSTLVSLIVSMFNPGSEQLLYIPQEIGIDLWRSVQNSLQTLDRKEAGLMFSAVHRLGSEPGRVIESPLPSPGEKRKIMLAMGLLKKASLIIMDEPTNHIDMPSIQCIESALRQYTGALVIVSHDPVFIRNTTDRRWEITHNATGSELKIIMN